MNTRAFIAGETELVLIKNVKLHPDWPYRKELGNIDSLARSMNGPNGQLQAICIDTSGYLVWGLRRFHVAKKNEWTHILARIIDFSDPLVAMREENENRLNFSQSELTRLMRCIEATERTKAKVRRTAGVQEKFPDGSTGQARDKAAAPFGFSGKTFEAMKIVDDHGTHELKTAWDAGDISTHDAANVATLSADIQNQAVADVKAGKVRTVFDAAKARVGPTIRRRAPKDQRNGSIIFDWSKFYTGFGTLIRAIDQFGSAYNCKETPEATRLRGKLGEFLKDFEAWTELNGVPTPNKMRTIYGPER